MKIFTHFLCIFPGGSASTLGLKADMVNQIMDMENISTGEYTRDTCIHILINTWSLSHIIDFNTKLTR